jgi:hypothetical protein
MKLAAGNPTEPDELTIAYLSGFYDGRKKRPWVGLTDEEIAECFKITPDQYLPWQIYKRIETKLKEKNFD